MLKSISGVLGAATLLLLLATAGSVMFPEKTPSWVIMLGAAIVCGVLSVVTFRQSKK
jgi:CDP-diglyceride synthetase